MEARIERAYALHWADKHASRRGRLRIRWSRLSLGAHVAAIFLGLPLSLLVGLVLDELALELRLLATLGVFLAANLGILVLLALHRETPRALRSAFT